MATAQDLIDLSTELTNVVNAANKIVATKELPYDTDTQKLVDAAAAIATHASAIGQAGLSALANDVKGAIGQLKTQVASANTTLKQLQDVKKALNIVGVVLTGAASVAASVATGNWVGAVVNVVTLATNLNNAIGNNQP